MKNDRAGLKRSRDEPGFQEAKVRVGVSFDGNHPPQTLLELARAAEAAEAGTLWVASHLFQRDPLVNASMVLANTRRLSVGLMAMSPFVMHPVHITMAAAALDEWFPGRVSLCLGVGAPRDLAALEIKPARPLRAISESIAVARALLSGDAVHFEGARYQAKGRRLSSGTHDIPILVAASGPKMLELAGAEADGVLISAATSPAFINRALHHVVAGEAKSGRRVHKAVLVYAAIGEDGLAARDRLRRSVGFVLRGQHHARNLALAGTRLDQAALADAFAAEDWSEVDRLVNEQVMDHHTASGTAEQTRAALRAYAAVGLDEIVLAGVGGAGELGQLLNVVLEGGA
jgi:5,10-methylenetetrahydromethanopterin reductase